MLLLINMLNFKQKLLYFLSTSVPSLSLLFLSLQCPSWNECAENVGLEPFLGRFVGDNFCFTFLTEAVMYGSHDQL